MEIWLNRNIWITEIECADGTVWRGETIFAKSKKEAEKWKEANGKGYLRVVGKLGFVFRTYEWN